MALVMIPNPKTQSKRSLLSGFTLLEMLLVVAIIAVLAGIAVVAINPGKQLATVRNTERTFNLSEIHKAMQQYFIDHYIYPAATPTTLTEICNTGSNSTSTGIDCTGLIDLSPLVPTYLTSIPIDPQGSTLSFINNLIPKVYATTNGTGYKVMKDTNNKIVLTAPQAELSAFIAIGTTTTATASCTATGGTITEVGLYKIHTFTEDSTFTVTSDSCDVDVLVVAGGGGGGNSSWGCGGGGGGGVISTSTSMSGENTVVVGAGGERNAATSGGNSSFSTYTATGGGAGGYSSYVGANGGSGGGGPAGVNSGGTGIAGQGYNGGNANYDNGAQYWNGGGGGGASVVGAAGGINNGNGGNGGAGYSSDISGTTQVYGSGGGGAGANTDGTGGSYGLGGTGAGNGMVGRADQTVIRVASDATYYGGGGGGAHQTAMGNAGYGYQGIVIVKYLK